jgi:undecaprenyl diphosphate synthase
MQHLAIIPDGNRRWAKANKLESVFGHRKGMDVVKMALTVCVKKGIKFLSFYTFSLENFKRSEAERSYLFSMLSTEFRTAIPELVEQGVRVRFLGDESYFPESIRATIKEVESATESCTAINLNLLFCYGARQEIVHAAKVMAQKIKDGLLDVDSITEESLGRSLWTGSMPDPDLILRTGMANSPRISNFLLYQAAYSEWMFLDEYWPQMTEELLGGYIEKFDSIKRNFGT